MLVNTLAKTKGAATHARDVREVWATGVRPFHELFSSYRRKSFILKLKYLFGCKNYRKFRRFFSPPKKPKNAGCFGKNAGMRETTKFAGFPARLRDGWHLWMHDVRCMMPMMHSWFMKWVTCSFKKNYNIKNSQCSVCVYHLFVRYNVGTIEYRSINKNKHKLSDWLTGTECVNHSINITFGEPW